MLSITAKAIALFKELYHIFFYLVVLFKHCLFVTSLVKPKIKCQTYDATLLPKTVKVLPSWFFWLKRIKTVKVVPRVQFQA